MWEMRWTWGAAAIVAIGLVFVATSWVHAGILAYHAVCLAAIVRYRKSIRPLFVWDRRILAWTFGTTVVIAGGLLLPLLVWDPETVRDRSLAVLFPTEGRGRFFLLFAAYTLLAHFWLEEIFWRGAFTDVTAGVQTVVLANAAGFYLVHVVALTWALGPVGLALALPTAAAGAIWGFVTHRTRSIWPALVSHFAADVVILGGMWIYLLR
jgi:membrane protease YdiL (CAAX protease family)